MRIGIQTWGSEGDVRPFLALAAGLVRAGHETTLCVADVRDRDYGAYAARHGFTLRSLPGRCMSTAQAVSFMRTLIASGDPVRQTELLLRTSFDPLVPRMFEAARELCSESDAVVGHFFLHPLHAAAELAKIPLAKVVLAANCLPSREFCPHGLPDLGPWMRPLAWRLARAVLNRIVLQRINTLRTAHGLPPERDVTLESWFSPRLNLVAVSPTLCRVPSDWGDRHSVCGFFNVPEDSAVEPLPPGLDDFLAMGPPPVYFGFGSMLVADADAVRETAAIWAEATRLADCRAVFQLPQDDTSSAGFGPDVHVLRRAPHAAVYPRCAAVVHHAGAGTTQTALLAGRPCVPVPHISDQFFWAAELERLGVAPRPVKRKRLTARALAAAVRQALDDRAMTRRAGELGAAMAREDGVSQAVRLIQSRLLAD